MNSLLLLLILVLAIGLPLVWLAVVYNGLVRHRNRLREGWSGVEVQLKRRHDLIPQLVAAVKGYQRHEASALESVVASRSAAVASSDVKSSSVAESRLGEGLTQLLVVTEDNPELRSDEHFRQLMSELVETEDAIQYARRYYNGSVRELNNAIESFPTNVVAALMGFQPADFFETEDKSERQAPQIALG